jgi:hypothetical protein
MKVYPPLIALLGLTQLLAAVPSLSQSQPNKTAPSKSYCEFSNEELEVYRDQLKRDTSSKSTTVVMATTQQLFTDVDSFNLPLAVQGHALPPEVRADFTNKNKASCLIHPFSGVANLHFMSEGEEKSLVSSGWSEFLKKYGKSAETVAVSRVGFNSDKTLALLHVLYWRSGELYLLERKNGKWEVKFSAQTMFT